MPSGVYKRIPKTHCPQGHEYSVENTYLVGERNHIKVCKTCLKSRKLAMSPEYQREYLRKYRKKHPGLAVVSVRKWEKENKEKLAVHKEFTLAVRRGDIERKNCQVCDNPKADGHHEDYSKPFEVIWLCRSHHKQLHAGKLDRSLLLKVNEK